MLLFAAEEIFRGISYGSVLPEDVIYWRNGSSLLRRSFPGFGSHSVWLCASRRPQLPLEMEMAVAPELCIDPVCCHLQEVPICWLNRPPRRRAMVDSHGLAGRRAPVLRSVRLPADSLQPGAHRPLLDGPDAMADQVYGPGVGGLFALRVYLASQALLFSAVDTGLGPINAVALIAANLLFSFSLVRVLGRGRSLNVDIYLSLTAIQNSLTLILAGVYLLLSACWRA